jgi:hypothetical protein
VHLQLTPGVAFSSPMAAAKSPDRTVVSAQPGSVSVVDATYLGRVFNPDARLSWEVSRHTGRDLSSVRPMHVI